MRIQRSTLADGALLLLGVGVAALVVGVLTGTLGGPDDTTTTAAPRAVATPTVSLSPSPSAGAADEQIDVLWLGDAVADGFGPTAGQALGWTVTVDAAAGSGFTSGPPDTQYAARAATAVTAAPYDVVVLAASTTDADPANPGVFGGSVAAAIAAVRNALPEAEVVLIGPPGTEAGTFQLQRDVLSATAARFGAYFVDPVGRQWLVAKPALSAGGAPNDAGFTEMARRLSADLGTTFPTRLLPGA